MSAPEEEGARVQRLLTADDVALVLGVPKSLIYALVRRGELPAIKIGGRGQWRIERSRLEEYIERKYAETAEWIRQNPLAVRDDEE
jgi:excisionase family DNA binding protein